jgi:hypothetical protein
MEKEHHVYEEKLSDIIGLVFASVEADQELSRILDEIQEAAHD